ncbi:MAG: hypothetical protein ABJA80_08585 [bacterium]
MLTRTALALALLVPGVASAQLRRPPGSGGERPQPVPLGRQPEAIARASALERSKVSFEAYPLISRVSAPSAATGNPARSWMSVGSGTRIDYRIARTLSWTVDLTSSLLGGSSSMETAETGFRLHSANYEDRLRPYVDARIGYEIASEDFNSPFPSGAGAGLTYAPVSRYSRGGGGLVGAGAAYSLSSTFSLTAGVAAMRTNMVAYRFDGFSMPTAGDRFLMTTYRLTLGINYNPLHRISNSVQSAPASP